MEFIGVELVLVALNGEPGLTVIIEKRDSLNPGIAVKCSRKRITFISINPRKIKIRFNQFVILLKNDFLLDILCYLL